ncbi:MAG: twin-arginine translocase subunit TatC [Gammaproteobacteria bacterium]|nr:twin-arginine translocase subunit TatC [Gammaproteobacteria bacterium]NNJ71943.1 twin-arginine translocase subunit TatC [Enterobacterales bacterium]
MAEMPLMEHLVELRSRLIRMVLAILIIFFSLFYWATDLYHLVAKPLLSAIPNSSSMIATDVLANFFTPFKLTMVLSIFIAMPYLLSQIWGFIAPGLYTHERRLAVPLMISSTLLFYSGLLFAYFVVFPLAFGFLASIELEGVQTMPDITSYLDTVLKLFFAFGITFEIPVAIILLVKMGFTNQESLRAKRPYVIVGVFIIGMLLTPPDVISQTLLAIPMWVLYEIGIYFAGFVTPKDKQETT